MEVDEAFSLISRAIDTGRAAHGYLVVGDLKGCCDILADRIEKAGDEFHARLRTGFAALAKAEPDRIVTIDANGTPDEVWELVWKSMRRFR